MYAACLVFSALLVITEASLVAEMEQTEVRFANILPRLPVAALTIASLPVAALPIASRNMPSAFRLTPAPDAAAGG